MTSSLSSYYEKVLATDEIKCIDEDIPFEIPQGWEWCRVASIFQINPKIVAEDNSSAAFIPMEAISAGYGSEFRYYEKKWDEIKSGYTTFADNDIAFAKITPCFQNRKSAIFEGLPNGIGAGTTELKILRTYGETINRWYVLYFLETPYFIDEATFKGTANQQRIIVGYLENKLFPVPPLAEQERIVSKISQVMPIVDRYSKSQEYLDKMNSELNDLLKKSILQEAIQGKLVPQLAEEGTAKELLEQIKMEKKKLVVEGKLKKSALNDSVIFKGDDNRYWEKSGDNIVCIDEEIPFEIPQSWMWVRLSSILNVGSARRVHEKDWRNSGIPFYRAREIAKLADNGFVDNDLFIDQELYDEFSTSGVPLPNDLMVTAVGTLGKVYIVGVNDKFYYKDGSVLRLANAYKLCPHYLKMVIESSSFRSQYTMESQGTTVATLTMVRLNNYFIPLPPIDEQYRIVEKYRSIAGIMSR